MFSDARNVPCCTGNHESTARPARMIEVDREQRSDDDIAHGQGWNRPRACSRSFSSWETSTLLGVSRKTWSATRCMLPPTA